MKTKIRDFKMRSRSPLVRLGGSVASISLDYRTVIPDRFVYILAAMFIDASSWNSSFAA